MGTQQGNYDNPSYLVRQNLSLGKSVAGANGTSCIKGFPTSDMRIRNVAAAVVTAGTSATSGHQAILYCLGTCVQISGTTTTTGTATTSLGVIVLGTSSVGQVGTSGDLNTIIKQGSIIFAKNGTDTTGVFDLVGEIHIDPSSVVTAP